MVKITFGEGVPRPTDAAIARSDLVVYALMLAAAHTESCAQAAVRITAAVRDGAHAGAESDPDPSGVMQGRLSILTDDLCVAALAYAEANGYRKVDQVTDAR